MNGILARPDCHRFAVNSDLSLIGGVETIEDRHQGRLAGAVFANDAVDCALGHGQVDILVGVDLTELLVDAGQFYCGGAAVAICLPPARVSGFAVPLARLWRGLFLTKRSNYSTCVNASTGFGWRNRISCGKIMHHALTGWNDERLA